MTIIQFPDVSRREAEQIKAWEAYVEACTLAQASLSFDDAHNAGITWSKFLALYDPRPIGGDA